MTRTIGTLAFAIALVAGVGVASAVPFEGDPSNTGPDHVWENVFVTQE